MKLIAGIDEVGRGALAGPVVASAVILNSRLSIARLKDSKKLKPLVRETVAANIRESAVDYAIGEASVEEIDRLNILNATLLAMERAVSNLRCKPHEIWVDGIHTPSFNLPTHAFVRGDQLHPVISAASVIAKVFRDAFMDHLHLTYPEYGFIRHKGYGTAEHLRALHGYGRTKVHRRSFGVVKSCSEYSPCNSGFNQ